MILSLCIKQINIQSQFVDVTDSGTRSSTTLVLGDKDLSNGCAGDFKNPPQPCRSPDDDFLRAADTLLKTNDINTNNGARDFSQPSTPRIYNFDGSDILYSSFHIAMTKIAIPRNPGPVLAGGVEVFESKSYGTSFVAPIGVDTASRTRYGDWTQLTELQVMASQDGTVVELKQKDGSSYSPKKLSSVLARGETYVFNGVKRGEQLTANRPIQVDMITGDKHCEYNPLRDEMRWYALTPRPDFGNSYYTPVSRDSVTRTSELRNQSYFFVGSFILTWSSTMPLQNCYCIVLYCIVLYCVILISIPC